MFLVRSGTPCLALIMATIGASGVIAFDGGFKGGGGAHRAGGARVSHMGGARPSMPGPSARPNIGNASARPQVNMPQVNRPQMNRPAPTTRPAANPPTFNRPNIPTTLPSARPNVQLPQVNRPNSQRPNFQVPNINRPSTLPGNVTGGLKPANPKPPSISTRPVEPNRPGISTRPAEPNRPDISTRPNLPELGNRPVTLPEKVPNLPNLGGNRPTNKLPEGPGGNRLPSTGGNRLPTTRPSTLPGQLPGNRPSPGDIGDFLGINSVRPVTPTIPSRPNIPTTRPRPQLPPLNPGDLGGALGNNKRPINIGQINVGNTNLNINNKINWNNIDNNRFNSIQNNWSNQLGGLNGWPTRYPARVGYWNGWANGVRVGWRAHHLQGNWFTGNWWYAHPGGCCRWHYYHRFNYHPWNYWWRRPAWPVFTTWFVWSAPAANWSQPIYYDYGSGGNVTYENNNVYINGQQVASTADFAQSAATLATVPPPASEQEAEEAEWLPLGVFAISTGEDDTQPNRVVQLAVSKQGIVSGTLYNYDTDEALAVQGQVDKQTQRVAIRLGDLENVVVETGLYNLTQDEVPVLVHFTDEKMEEYLLVRLEDNASEDSQE